MTTNRRPWRRGHAWTLVAGLTFLCLLASGEAASTTGATGSNVTTAWRAGRFHVDVRGVVERSDVILAKPNSQPNQSLPLGNGSLGIAVWAANGLTAQINRVDTLPFGYEVGTLSVPGLEPLVASTPYRGRLNLYDGSFTESNGHLAATSYVRHDKDEIVVDVRGADPATTETATIALPRTRPAQAWAEGSVAGLSATWRDTRPLGGSGRRFGSLALLTAGGRMVRASVSGPNTIKITFKPRADGSFRIVVGAPHWAGGDVRTAARNLLAHDAAPTVGLQRPTTSWWHTFWQGVGLLKLSSPDGEAQYVENLRDLNLFTQAASSSAYWPGSHGGVANLFMFSGDGAPWCTFCYWEWNLRMAVGANLGAGAFAENAPFFRLYRSNLANIEAWTRAHMNGRPGACVPETMSYNGNGYSSGYFNSGNLGEIKDTAACDSAVPPFYNARILTSGTEVALWIWRQYRFTLDRAFLRANFPLMAEAARFLLAYARPGSDGKLHTDPSNAHETQEDTRDPITDIAAMHALFPVVVKASALLHTDVSLAERLRQAEAMLLPLPTDTLNGKTVFRFSDQPLDHNKHNVENLTLEPVWPYGLIGDDNGAATTAAINSYYTRPFPLIVAWDPDPIQAARLGLADQVRHDLVVGTGKFQTFISGFAIGAGTAPYIEWNAVVGIALQDALVQADDGTLRIASAWPKSWSAEGTVFIPGGNRVNVQFQHGRVTTVAIQAQSTNTLAIRSPWPGQLVEVVDGLHGSVVRTPTRAKTFRVTLAKGHSYVLQRASEPLSRLPYAEVTGAPAASPKVLDGRSIGLP